MKLFIPLLKNRKKEVKENENHEVSEKIEKSKYIDILSGFFTENNRWKSLSILLTSALTFSIAINLFEYFYFINKFNSVRYIAAGSSIKDGIHPGEVFLDRVADSYVQSIFETVAFKMSTWSYLNYENSMKDLFKYYFSPNLANEQQVNIANQGMIQLINSRKAVSTFTIDREKSVYKWCKAIDAACGFVAGHEKIDQGISPWKETDIAYFLIANQKIPSRENSYFALTVTRLIRCESIEQCQIYLDGAEKGTIKNDSLKVTLSDAGGNK